MNFLRVTASGRLVWLISPSLADRGGLPLPVYGSVASAVRAAADLLPPSARQALLIEDAASLAAFQP